MSLADHAVRFIAFSFLAILITACGGGGSDGGNTGSSDTTAPTVLSTHFVPISSSDAIVIIFNESMDINSQALGGTLAAQSDGGMWSTTNVANDTLTITPMTTWIPGPGQTLNVDATDDAATPNALATLAFTFDIYNSTLYFVDSAATDDSGDGLTPDNAKQTILAAINAATAPATVLVNAGTFNVNSDPGSPTHIIMKEGVSLYGGYDALFMATRDPGTNVSAIVDTSTMVGTFDNLNRAVEAGPGVTSATRMTGFTIYGTDTAGGGAWTSAVWIHGNGGLDLNDCILNGATSGQNDYTLYITGTGSSDISNNLINGGSPSFSSYGIGLMSTAVSTISLNTIQGGDNLNGASSSRGMIIGNAATHNIETNYIAGGSTSFGTGIVISSGATPVIVGNTISGTGTVGTGITINSGSPVIRNNNIIGNSGASGTGIELSGSGSMEVYSNRIYGGTGSGQAVNILGGTADLYNNLVLGNSGPGTVSGIVAAGGTTTLRNNTIHAGDGSATNNYGIRHQAGSLTVENNIILTANTNNSYCFSESDVGADPVSLRNNNFINCSTALYRDYVDGTGCGVNDICITTAAGINAMADTTASGNISVDPALSDIDGLDNNINNMTTNDWSLSGSTPVSVSTGGLNGIDQGWSFTDDFNGVARPASGNPWSIGAYEP